MREVVQGNRFSIPNGLVVPGSAERPGGAANVEKKVIARPRERHRPGVKSSIGGEAPGQSKSSSNGSIDHTVFLGPVDTVRPRVAGPFQGRGNDPAGSVWLGQSGAMPRSSG